MELIGEAQVTPRFFSREFPGDEAMDVELASHWDIESGKPTQTVNLFLVKKSKSRNRIRVQLSKDAARKLAVELQRLTADGRV